MKTAIVISGLPRKVEEGYNQFWKPIIEKYNTDVYLHFWEDEEYQKVLSLYNPKKYISEKPFSFENYVNGLEADESLSRPTKPYDVAGNFRGFPMFHSWQRVSELVENDYDYVIRGRYDLAGYCNLQNVDKSKINISAWHWGRGHEICDDNLYVSNSELYKKIHSDAFDDLIENANSIGRIYFQEKNFTEMIKRKGLYHLVNKHSDLKFDLLRENIIWY
jgi:hypothetical protein